MTASEFWLLVVACIAAVCAYWAGRSDGYWLRAEEEVHREIDAIVAAHAAGSSSTGGDDASR